jgi:hypothetical protein
MSIAATDKRRPYQQACEDAVAMKSLFPESTYARLKLAGSIRRKKHEVGDVDFVLIPRFGEVVDPTNLFAAPKTVNLFWYRMDALVELGTIAKHFRTDEKSGKPVYCWGEKQRRVRFRDYVHEFYCADETNWGSVFAVKTGPGGYSKMLVTALQTQGYVCRDGFFVFSKRDLTCSLCGWRGTEPKYAKEPLPGDEPAHQGGEGAWWVCRVCGKGAGLVMAPVVVPEEEDFLKLCGVKIEPPEARQDPPERHYWRGGGR